MNDMITENTVFTWIDGSTTEASLKQITEGFAGKYGKQKSDLKEVVVGDSARTIELNAFRLCKNLEKAAISDRVTDIREFAFAWCDSLKEVRLPAQITRLNISVFQGCSALESIVIPEKVSIIDEQAFSKCTALKSVKLPEVMYWLSNECFDGCESLEEIDIPSSVEIIDAMAFSNCTALKEVRFAEAPKLREFGPNAFEGCTAMKFVTPEPFTALQRIAGHAFERCESLESFTICDNLVLLGESAFAGCVSLGGEITLPESLKTFGTKAFMGCRSLEKVTIKKNQKNTLPLATFACCEKLHTVEGLEWITEIGAFAFLGCTALEHVTIGLSLSRIDDWAFKGCISLKLSLPPVMTGTDVFAYIRECSLREASVRGLQQFYSSPVHRIRPEDTLRLAALDAACALRRIRMDGAVPEDIFREYEEKLMAYVNGTDERTETFGLLDEFDVVYGTEEFPLSQAVEMFRDKLYLFSQEIRLG